MGRARLRHWRLSNAYAAVDDLEKVLHEATMGGCGTGEHEDQVTVEIVPLYGARHRCEERRYGRSQAGRCRASPVPRPAGGT
jgi:hypothetical protein